MRYFISGCATRRCISLLIFVTMVFGVPAGNTQPCSPSDSILNPASAIVGTSGSEGERFAVVTASARTLPLRICGIAGGIDTQPSVTSFAMTAANAGPPPL